MTLEATVNDRPTISTPPRILVVDDEPTLRELVDDVVGRKIHCQMLSAGSLREARQILASQEIELLVADVNLPDGDGLSLLPTLRAHQPNASAIVITGAPSVDGAISALRHGALDFVPKPFSAEQICDRVQKALDRQALLARHDRRLQRLREAVKRLNEARKVVSKKVDLLCNDLIQAYGDLAKQLDVVRTQESFRKYLSQSKDLEQLLCHTMDWLLRQLGYCNVAIWLAADDEEAANAKGGAGGPEFQLGAYMKYTIAGEQDLTNAMRQGLIPLTLKEGFVRLSGDQVQSSLTPHELDYLADQSIISVNCTYLGEPLAVVTLFRDDKDAFSDDDAATLKQISPILAVALAEIVRGTQKYETDDNPFYGGEGQDGYRDEDEPRDGHKKRDPADWWKRGEQPPF